MSYDAVLDGFLALSEFWQHNDTCGEDAWLMLEHLADGRPLTGPEVDAIRADMAAHGMDVNHGTTMSELVNYFRDVRHLDAREVCGYGTPVDQIHVAIRDEFNAAKGYGVVVQLNHAYALPDQEPGVFGHFIAIGGIHPVLGYYVGNGDALEALNVNHGHGKTYPPRWIDWPHLAAAEPVAVGVLPNLKFHTPSAAEEKAGADGTQEQVSQEAPAPIPNAPVPAPEPVLIPNAPVPAPGVTFLDASNVAAIRSDLSEMRNQLAQHLVTVARLLASLPNV